AWVLWRKRSAADLMFCVFIVLFGSFMMAPRMHERYLYPALIFAVPLALEDPMMLAVLGVMIATCLFNLAYIKHVLDLPNPFLDARDALAMAASAINTVAFGLAVFYGFAPAGEEGGRRTEAGIAGLVATLRSARASAEPVSRGEEPAAVPMPWMRADTIIIALLVGCAILTRFWRLGHPAEIVFDEVHFVGQARHYLHGEPFLDPHPPLAKLLIALGILMRGDHPASWRFPNAIIGTILVGITY